MTRFGFALIFALVVASPAVACNGGGNCDNAPGQVKKQVRGAPVPVAGAGLPSLVIGYGVYWLVKRRRKAVDDHAVPSR